MSGVISRGVDRCVKEFSAGCKQSMFAENVAQKDASSSTEESVADMAFASRLEAQSPLERSAEPSSPPVKLLPPHVTGKVKSSVQDQGVQYPLPNTAVRDSLLEQTVSPKPKEIRSSGEDFPPQQAISLEAHPEVEEAIPIEDREWNCLPCGKHHPSGRSLEISS